MFSLPCICGRWIDAFTRLRETLVTVRFDAILNGSKQIGHTSALRDTAKIAGETV